ncbi:MAG: hypothetical protein O3C60_15600 [Planctomycetota bacterium]|nr:hypothetical protein [Planctomycetota bacterium]
MAYLLQNAGFEEDAGLIATLDMVLFVAAISSKSSVGCGDLPAADGSVGGVILFGRRHASGKFACWNE